MPSVLLFNGCSSQTLNWVVLAAAEFLTGQLPPAEGGSSLTITLPAGATAIGLTGFTGDAYVAAPGASIGDNLMELAGVDSGGTLPALNPPSSANGQVMFFDATVATATWVMATTDIGPLTGSVAPGYGAPEPLANDVTWLGFTGVTADVYALTPDPTSNYQATLMLLNLSSAVSDVRDAIIRAR